MVKLEKWVLIQKAKGPPQNINIQDGFLKCSKKFKKIKISCSAEKNVLSSEMEATVLLKRELCKEFYFFIKLENVLNCHFSLQFFNFATV
jgi:hypothetical protein